MKLHHAYIRKFLFATSKIVELFVAKCMCVYVRVCYYVCKFLSQFRNCINVFDFEERERKRETEEAREYFLNNGFHSSFELWAMVGREIQLSPEKVASY